MSKLLVWFILLTNRYHGTKSQQDLKLTAASKTPECFNYKNYLWTRTLIDINDLVFCKTELFLQMQVFHEMMLSVSSQARPWIWRGLGSLPLIILINHNTREEITLSVLSEVLSPHGRDPDTQRQFSLPQQSADQDLVRRLFALSQLLQPEHRSTGCLCMLLMSDSSSATCG